MYLCDFVRDISCGACPFRYNSECGEYSSKEMIIQEMEDMRDNIIFWLPKIKEGKENV